MIICACMPVLTPLQEAKLDPVYHDALVQQNRVYNALPQVREHAQEYRRGPVGYPIKVINDAIRSVRAHLRHLFFTHLTILYSRHFECDVLVDDATKTARNAALRSELAPFVEAHMLASGRCAQFNSVLVRTAKSCNSLSINRCSHMSHSSQIFHSSHTYRIDSAILDYRPASGNVQVLLI